jgi:hypothetical protein
MECKHINTHVNAMAAYVGLGDEEIIPPLFLNLVSRYR